jgi:hypothetical protein
MNATLTQNVQETGTDSKVTYDRLSRTITVPIFVSLNPDQSISWEIDPVTLPKDEWTLVWNLEVGTPGLSAHFREEDGIVLSSLPPDVSKVLPPARVSATQWKATFRNEILPVSGFNGFKYEAHIGWSTEAGLVSIPSFHHAHHDPTIAVTSEPIDG